MGLLTRSAASGISRLTLWLGHTIRRLMAFFLSAVPFVAAANDNSRQKKRLRPFPKYNPGSFLQGIAGFCRLRSYRLQQASVWGDRSSLRALRLLSAVVVVGAAVMLLSGEELYDQPSFMATLASLRGADMVENTDPVAVASPPAVAGKSGEEHVAEEKKNFGGDWPTPPFEELDGAESRGTLSAHTSLDPKEGLQGNIRPDAAAYNESAEAPLADVARQADAALIQALARQGLGADSLELVDSETRFTADSLVYPFLRLTVRPGTETRTNSPAKSRRVPVTSATFGEVLADSLDVWAPAAQLHKEGPNWFLITVGDAVTHSIRWEERAPVAPPAGKSTGAPGPSALPPSRSPALPAGQSTGLAAGQSAGNSAVPELTDKAQIPALLPEMTASEDAQARHSLTIVIDDIGESLSAARELLDLPYPVTFAIWPRSSHAAHIATLAHERGRQVFLHQPMEPLSETGKRMGPGGLRVGMTDAELADCLRVNLRLVPYVEGVNNHMGSRFTSDAASARQFCAALRRMRPDVMVLDSLTLGASVLYDEARTQEFVAFRRTLFLDDARGKESILKELDHGLELARHNGQTIVIGHPRPDTLAALAAWRGFRERDVSIVPLAQRPDNTNGGLPASQTEQP